MKIARLSIANYRGIKAAEFHFEGHALMVGANNVGKSTICEALDLVLGPDRLNRFPPVEEFDFYNAQYLTAPEVEGVERQPISIRIEVVLIDLSQEVENRCGANLEFWNTDEQRVLSFGEAEATNPPNVVPCLRLETLACYNAEEDEFEADTYFSHSPQAEDGGKPTPVRRHIKRLFGFRIRAHCGQVRERSAWNTVRLLDMILRLKSVRTGLWEKAITRLRNLDIEQDATALEPVLKSIEERLSRYIPSKAETHATKLHVSQLTREHLRKTMASFWPCPKDQVTFLFNSWHRNAQHVSSRVVDIHRRSQTRDGYFRDGRTGNRCASAYATTNRGLFVAEDNASVRHVAFSICN